MTGAQAAGGCAALLCDAGFAPPRPFANGSGLRSKLAAQPQALSGKAARKVRDFPHIKAAQPQNNDY
ncbi:MAG: hypothetical protein AB1757_06385 [Acidobacteriota bacterium]